MTRTEKVAEAQGLRAEGLKLREIAERMGAPISTVDQWINDPDLAKHRARLRRYGGQCVDCGKPTSARKIGDASKRCLHCEQHRNTERDQRILELWEAGETGERIAATLGLTYPQVAGTVDRARQRLGDVPLHRRRNRELWPLIEARWNEGVPTAEIAAEAGISPENLHFQAATMRRLGFNVPSRLHRVDINVAEATAKYRAGWSCQRIAASIGCSQATVWRRLKDAGVEMRAVGRRRIAA